MKSRYVLPLVFLWGVMPWAAVRSADVKVGTLFDHTGALKDWGPRHQHAVELAVDQMAEAGWTIQCIHKDSETAAEPAQAAARNLISEHGVAAIIGSSSSGVIIPVAEAVTIPNHLVLISPGATSPFISELPEDAEKDLVFRTCPSDALQGVVLGKLAASLYKTASVMYVNNAYGQGLAQQFHRSFQKRGGVVFTMIPHGEEVAESYVSDLRKAFTRVFSTRPYISGKSDVLCVFSYPEHAKVYVSEAIEVYNCDHFLFCDGSKSEELAHAVGFEKLEGMMGTAPGVAVGDAFFTFTREYENAYGELPTSPFIANAYDAAAVIGLASYAAKMNNDPDTSPSLRDHLRQVANPPGAFIGPDQFKQAFDLLAAGKAINYEGASGSVDFDENGDVVAPIEVWRFADGKIVTYRMEYQIENE